MQKSTQGHQSSCLLAGQRQLCVGGRTNRVEPKDEADVQQPEHAGHEQQQHQDDPHLHQRADQPLCAQHLWEQQCDRFASRDGTSQQAVEPQYQATQDSHLDKNDGDVYLCVKVGTKNENDTFPVVAVSKSHWRQ